MLEDRILPGAIVVFDEVGRSATWWLSSCPDAHQMCMYGWQAAGPTPVLSAAQLVNYPAYRDHEVKAMWEWLRRTGRKLEVIGMMGPLQQVLPPCHWCIVPQTSMLSGGHMTRIFGVRAILHSGSQAAHLKLLSCH